LTGMTKVQHRRKVFGEPIIPRKNSANEDEGVLTKGEVQVGDKAPDFELPDQSGNMVKLGDYLGKKAVVLYFYPKDFSHGCTKEACAFRDSYEQFKDLGAEVVGVSSDTQESHGLFSTKLGLPFMLLSDEGGRVRKLYGVPASLGLLPGRVTYVIDKSGIVRHIFNSQIDAEQHMHESLRILKTLQ
jgi:peroxiredoxin Q/BCP